MACFQSTIPTMIHGVPGPKEQIDGTQVDCGAVRGGFPDG